MYENTLTPAAKKLFPHLARFRTYYLVGGTSLALQIGHRVSVDFDMFTSERLPSNLYSSIKRIFKYPVSLTYRSPEQLNVLVANVKMTFFSFPYSTIYPLITYRGVKLASVKEIASMKAFAIGKRLAYKDYVDWYFLLKDKHVILPEVIVDAEKKFGTDFNSRLFLGQLASFADVPTQQIDFLKKKISRHAIELYLESAVRDVVKQKHAARLHT